MNKIRLDKFQSHISASRGELRHEPTDHAVLRKRQASFLSRRYGISAERACTIAPLIFNGGPA